MSPRCGSDGPWGEPSRTPDDRHALGLAGGQLRGMALQPAAPKSVREPEIV